MAQAYLKKEPLYGETKGKLICCVEPSYTENAGSVEKKNNQKLQCMSTKIK